MIRFLYGAEDDCADPASKYIEVVHITYEHVGERVLPHDHEVGHWSLVLEGTVEYTVGDKISEITAPHRVWIPRRVRHSMIAKTAGAKSLCLMPA